MFTLLKSGQHPHYKIAYINARIIDPKTKLDILGYLITEGQIIKTISSEPFTEIVDEIVDCLGHLLIPGVIDIHVHLREPGEGHKETIETGTKAAAAGGVTTVVCQPNTKPRIEDVITLEWVLNKAKETGYVNVKAYSAITKNNSLSDMLSLYEAGAVGFTDDGLPVMNAFLMKQALIYSSMINAPIAQHAEDLELTNGGCINEGEISSELNVIGIPNSSEAVMVARDLILLAETGAHYHLLHVSTKEAVESISLAKAKGARVSCEVTPHHLLLTEEEVRGYNTLAKMNPPLRGKEDKIALINALKAGIIDAIASDHAPHDSDSKNLSLSKAAFGIVGLETILPLSLELYHQQIIPLYELLQKLTCNPAEIINYPGGVLQANAPADLIILDLNQEWVIDVNKFYSKSNNSPFNGRKVKGKVLRTVVKGKTVFLLDAPL